MDLALPSLGTEHTLESFETEGPKDTLCYCARCRYKRDKLDTIWTNFYYGFLFFGLWAYNCLLYLLSYRLSDQYEFSESIRWGHRDDVFLQQDLEDDSTLVGQLIKEHYRENREFDRVCGWSLMGICVLCLVIWLAVVLLGYSY